MSIWAWHFMSGQIFLPSLAQPKWWIWMQQVELSRLRHYVSLFKRHVPHNDWDSHSGSKFEFTIPVSVWLPLCSTHIQWQRQRSQKPQGDPRHFGKAEGKPLPKEYWREYPPWACPDDHFNSFWGDATGQCPRAIYGANTTSSVWSPPPGLAPDSWLQQWLWHGFPCHTTASGATLQHSSSTFPVHTTALTLLLLRRSVTFCYSHSSNIKKLQDFIWSGADRIAILGFRKCHWTRISQYIKDCFQTFKQLSESHFSSHSSQQIDTSLPHLMSENNVSVSRASWSASSLWTHSRPIS